MVTPAGAAGTIGFLQLCFDHCRGAAARLWRKIQRRLARADRYDLAAAMLFGCPGRSRRLHFPRLRNLQRRGSAAALCRADHRLLSKRIYRRGVVSFQESVSLWRPVRPRRDRLAKAASRSIPTPSAICFSALTGVGGIAAVWATARAIGGPRAGLLAAAAIALCGTWYGAMFNHTKDIPFAAAMMGATYLLVRIGRELPRRAGAWSVLFGVLCGCALGIRVLGVFLVAYARLLSPCMRRSAGARRGAPCSALPRVPRCR